MDRLADDPVIDDDAAERSLVDDARLLIEDARAAAAAELAYQKARTALAARTTRTVAVLGLLALALAFFALMALTLGLVLALTPLVGAWLATAIVVGAWLLGALACAVIAAKRAKATAAVLREPAGEP